MESLVNLNSSFKDMKHWTTYTGVWFVVVKICGEPDSLFRYDNGAPMYHRFY